MKLGWKTWGIFPVAGILLGLLFFTHVRNHMRDFEVNYESGKRLRQGTTLYRVADEHYMFKYSPAAALIYLPLSSFPLGQAKLVWFVLVVFSCGGIVYFSTRLIFEKQNTRITTVILAVMILARYFLREIELGQINALVTMIILAMLFLLLKGYPQSGWKHRAAAGFLWGTAVTLKPYAVIFLPYLLLKKRWTALAGGIVTMISGLMIPALYYGFRGNFIVLKEWIATLSQSTPMLLTSQDNISIIACLTKWTGNQTLSARLAGGTIAALALMVLYLMIRGRDLDRAEVLEGSLLLILIPLISPLGWDYTLLMSLPGIIILVHHFNRFERGAKIFLLANFLIITFSLYDLLGKTLYGRFMSLSVITMNYLAVVAYLAAIRLRRWA